MLFAPGTTECEPGSSGTVFSQGSVQVTSQQDVNLDLKANQQTIMENQQIIVNNQIKLMQALAKLQTGVDYLMENNMFGNHQSKDPAKILLKPVNSLAELIDLEESLKEANTIDKYVVNMGFICGTDGKASGMDSCYKLIDYFITREFMHSCSWTGNTKVTDENSPISTLQTAQSEATGKIPLKFYVHFRSLFLKLIRMADKDFTEMKCDEFFKRVMKNSKARLLAKSSSKHKNRPCNLKYKSRKVEATDGISLEKEVFEKGSEQTTVQNLLEQTQQV